MRFLDSLTPNFSLLASLCNELGNGGEFSAPLPVGVDGIRTAFRLMSSGRQLALAVFPRQARDKSPEPGRRITDGRAVFGGYRPPFFLVPAPPDFAAS